MGQRKRLASGHALGGSAAKELPVRTRNYRKILSVTRKACSWREQSRKRITRNYRIILSITRRTAKGCFWREQCRERITNTRNYRKILTVTRGTAKGLLLAGTMPCCVKCAGEGGGRRTPVSWEWMSARCASWLRACRRGIRAISRRCALYSCMSVTANSRMTCMDLSSLQHALYLVSKIWNLCWSKI